MSTSFQELAAVFQAELYLYFHEEFMEEARTKAEYEFIVKHSQLMQGAHILDLACGHGRHAMYFAEQGFEVTGIDLNAAFIDLARSQAKEKGITINFVEYDILDIEYTDRFDMILLLFNSIGFFDPIEARMLLEKMTEALKTGGRILLDTKNRDHLVKELVPAYVYEKNEDLMIDRLSFDPITQTTLNRRIYIKDGKRYDAPFSMTTYSYTDLFNLIKGLPLQMKQVWGSWKGDPFTHESRRIILILEKA